MYRGLQPFSALGRPYQLPIRLEYPNLGQVDWASKCRVNWENQAGPAGRAIGYLWGYFVFVCPISHTFHDEPAFLFLPSQCLLFLVRCRKLGEDEPHELPFASSCHQERAPGSR